MPTKAFSNYSTSGTLCPHTAWDFNFSDYNYGNPDWWGLPVTYVTNSQPQHGSLTDLGDGNYSYTSDPCYVGPDSFTYYMSDGLFTSPTGTVTVLTSDLISASYSPTTPQTAVNSNLVITLIGSDPCSSQQVSFLCPTSTTQGGTLSALNGNNQTTYMPSNNFSGIDSFEFQVVNQCGDSAGAIVFITVGTNSGSGGPFTVVTNNLSNLNGIDYSPAENALIASAVYGEEDDNFVQLSTDVNDALTATNFSDVTGLSAYEVKLAVVKQTLDGFTNGDVYFGSYTNVGWLSADGSQSNLSWCILTNNTVANTMYLRGGLYVDQTGVFSNEVIALASGGGIPEVWLANSNGNPTLLAQIDVAGDDTLEGIISMPNNTNQWGPWAGKILTGDETHGILYTIDTNGTVAPYDLGIASENFVLILTNQDFYACDYGNGQIVKISRAFLTKYAGALLIAQESPPELFIVNWNGTNFVTRAIYNYNGVIASFEQSCFAPINLPSQPIP